MEYGNAAHTESNTRYGSVVTQKNFDQVMALVSIGKAIMVISSLTKPILIDGSVIKKFRAAGYEVLKKDADKKGFRLLQGKNSNYIILGQIRFKIV